MALTTTFIKSFTASSDCELSFIDGTAGVVLDNTYDEYLFTFVNLHPSVDAAKVMWQSSTDGGSSYGVSTTTTLFSTYHHETSGSTNFGYEAGLDAAQSTADDLYLSDGVGFDNDQSGSGYMILYAPSDTTYVKHFTSELQHVSAGNTCNISRTAGFIDTTSAVDAIQFSFNSGDIDLGTIYLYGVG